MGALHALDGSPTGVEISPTSTANRKVNDLLRWWLRSAWMYTLEYILKYC